jgi:2-isopropylmalate synthase
MIKEKTTYEIMLPEVIGLDSSRLVLSNRSGRHAFRVRLESLGHRLSDAELEKAYARFLEIADKKKEVFDEDLLAILSDQIPIGPEEYQLDYMTVVTSLDGVPTATLRLRRGEATFTEAGTGVGVVDAVYRTIDKIIPASHRLIDYVVSAVTGGTDALAEVTVRLGDERNVFLGRGTSLDVVEASAKAYLQALNKLTYFGTHRPGAERVTPQV